MTSTLFSLLSKSSTFDKSNHYNKFINSKKEIKQEIEKLKIDLINENKSFIKDYNHQLKLINNQLINELEMISELQ